MPAQRFLNFMTTFTVFSGFAGFSGFSEGLGILLGLGSGDMVTKISDMRTIRFHALLPSPSLSLSPPT